MKLSRWRRRLASTLGPFRDARRIYLLSGTPPEVTPFSAFPPRLRKDVVRDLLRWRKQYGEVHTDFFLYGLDRELGRDVRDFVPYDVFKRTRDRSNRDLNGPEDYNYSCLLKDKFVFAQFVGSLGHPTPKNLGLLTERSVEWFNPRREEPIEHLWELDTAMDAFCKPLAGGQGKGVFSLRASGGKVLANGNEVTPRTLSGMLAGRSLLQERITQHPALSSLYPESVNTIRLITAAEPRGVRPLVAALKVGALGGEVDNWAQGGVAVRIDLDTGVLVGPGLFKTGRPYADRHPDSGVTFEGFEVPYFAEAVAAASRLHSDFYGFHSVGWDIAITPDGPSIIEGNESWGGYIPAALDSTFMRSYMELFGGVRPQPHRHKWVVSL